MINSVCGIRSTGRICTDLAETLSEQGHEVKIAYGRETVPEKYQKYAVRIGNDMDVKLHALQTRMFDNTGFCSRKVTKQFIRWVESYNPDIIHLHNIHGYYINIDILFRYLRTCGKKIIWTLHDCWAFTGHCTYFTAIKCDRWKKQCHHCPQKWRYPASYMLDHSKENYQRKKELFTNIPNMTLVTPSQWLADLVKQSFLSEYPVEVHYNTIDTTVFKPTPSNFREKYNLQGKKIILGVASVWNERKGLNDFIKLSEIIDDKFAIVLVGLSETQIKRMPKKIIAIRRTNSTKELAEIYTAADVFFNPTYEDNYPTTNLEAQSCGTPVITYKTGGSPESVPEKNVVDVGNIIQSAKRIKVICSLYTENKS